MTNKYTNYIVDEYTDIINRTLGSNIAKHIRLYNFNKNNFGASHIINNIHRINETLLDEKTKYIIETSRKIDGSYFTHLMKHFSDECKSKNIGNKHYNDLKELTFFSYKLAEDFIFKNTSANIGHKHYKYKNICDDLELLELHTYILKNAEKKLGNLGIHTDDETGVNYKTVTLIWYLNKSHDISGGNIFFYNNENEFKFPIFEHGDDEQTYKCLIFTGDIEHSPEKLSGTGVRKSIVFQFKRIDRNKKTKKRYKSLSLPKTRISRLSTKKRHKSLSLPKTRISRLSTKKTPY